MPVYHHNAKLSIHVREQIQINSDRLTMRQLADRFAISVSTVHKWSHRPELGDATCRPLRIRTLFDDDAQEIIVGMRNRGVSLDDIHDAVEKFIPGATRSSIYRLLKRRGLGKLPRPERPPHGTYSKDILPGFIHIDSFKLFRVVGQSRAQVCFVAVDRATRQVFAAVYDHHDSDAACDFLRRCQVEFSFNLHTIVTDNGAEYTLKATSPTKHKKGDRRPFELMCIAAGIKHKTIRPYTPQTNGLVERMNGEIKDKVIRNVKYQTIADRDDAIRAWNENYNQNRKHRNIPIGRMTPMEAVERFRETHPAIFDRQPLCPTL